jgi:hypothetical protein
MPTLFVFLKEIDLDRGWIFKRRLSEFFENPPHNLHDQKKTKMNQEIFTERKLIREKFL